MGILAIALWIVCQAISLAAPVPHSVAPAYHQDVWTVRDGLPHNVVTSIAQTPDGYLWLGTELGLVSFDGLRFRTYDRSNTPQLKSPAISALLSDREGTLWIGTRGGGLVSRSLAGQYGGTPLLAGQAILALAEAGDGRIWIGTDGGGLFVWKNGELRPEPGLADKSVFSIAEDSGGTLWVGTHKGLNRRSPKAAQFDLVNADHGSIRSLLTEPDGSLWIGSDEGLFRRYGQGSLAGIQSPIGHHAVTAMARDGRGAIWFGTVGGGAVRLQNGHFVQLSGTSLFALFSDRDGAVWMGTIGSGLVRMSTGVVTSVPELAAESMVATFEDSHGNLWAGSKGGGLHRIRPDGGATVFTHADGLSDDRVYAIGEDARGALWVGTKAGMDRYWNGKFSRLGGKDFAGQIPLVIHRQDDEAMWVGTRSGLFRFDRDGSVTHLTAAEGSYANNVVAIEASKDGGLWIGTGGNGVHKWKDGRFTSYPGLSNDVVLSLHEDSQGVLWVGTNGGGLNRLKNGVFSAVSSSDGLFDDSAFQILEDGAGNFWMSSNRGVYRAARKDLDDFLDHRRRHVTSVAYGTSDGMASGECNGGVQPAGVRTRDGRLWFPTAQGLAVMDPARAAKPEPAPPVIVERIAVDGREMALASNVAIPPGRGDLEVEYTAVNFHSPLRTYFRYRLVGFDADWTEAGARRSAFYTNIPPGKYRFDVESRVGDGSWLVSPASVRFQIQPRFYRRYWFMILMLLLSFALIWGMHGLSVKRLNERERVLAQRVDERTEELRLEVEFRKEAQVEALKAKRAAEEANKAKSEFLANISHEIRTPMNGIIGLTNLSLDGKLAPVDRENLEGVKSSAYGLLHLLNDVLDLSKIEAGKLELEPVVFGPRRTVASVIQLIQPSASEKLLKLESRIEPEVPDLVRGDELRLRQVLLNLMNNAVKFTPRGQVSVHLQLGAPAQLHFSVSDTGIGIARERFTAIFQPFEQGDGSTTRRFGGTGLGLAISEKLVQLMGGTISVESELGVGSTFRFTVNMKSAQAAARPVEQAPDTPPVPALRVLLVEDNRINQLVATRALEKMGHSVTLARDGMEAVEQATTCRFDCILMDVQMPQMDGMEATVRIRSSGCMTPIIAMTANVMKGDKELCLSCGMDAYLSKPFEPWQLAQVISQTILPRAPHR